MATKDAMQWLDSFGKDDYDEVKLSSVKDLGTKMALQWLEEVQLQARKYELIGKGTLTSKKGYRHKVASKGGITTIELFMIYYGMFQDRGVKGWYESKNAPNSPFQFKTKGISEEGMKSIKASIKSQRKKLKEVVKYKPIGLEKKVKKKDLNKEVDTLANQMAWNIKKYGIKTKPFFKKAYEKVFGKLEYEYVEALKKEWVTKLQIKNKTN